MTAGAVRRYAQCKSLCCLTLAAMFSALAPDAAIIGALLLMGAVYAGASLLVGRA